MSRLPGLGGTKHSTRELRGRDVIDRLKGKVDPEVVSVIAGLAEMQYALDKGMGEVAAMITQMAKINSMMVDVAGNMKAVIESHRRPDDDLQGGGNSNDA